jgi:hypothetical protein
MIENYGDNGIRRTSDSAYQKEKLLTIKPLVYENKKSLG